MCGLIGFNRAPKTSIPNGTQFMRTALVTIEDRGRHATGVGYTVKGDRQHVWHTTMEGRASKVARRLALPNKGMTNAIGHTRHATIGSSALAENRHPVVNEHIVLTHNGRCDNHEDLIKLANVERIGTVDSFALPAMLSRQEELCADHPTELLELVQGVAAVAWIDATENGVLHLARLSTRPLTVGWTKRGDFIYGSTPEALRRTARLTRVGIHDIEKVDEGTYMRVENGQIEDMQFFTVNHPPVLVPDDAPKLGLPKSVKLPTPGVYDADDLDWWAEYDAYDKRERESLSGITDWFSEA